MPGLFDAISLIHVLEHIDGPRQFLEQVKEKLKPGGWLIIQLPYYVENPFELFVADHSTHFDCPTIRALVSDAGFRLEVVETGWVTKEISLVARNLPPAGDLPAESVPLVPPMLGWLGSVIAQATSVASQSPRFGLFGTAIAATWLFSELAGKVAFFVDEEPARVGKELFGLPIYAPSAVPADSDVYVGLAPKIARNVCLRLHTPSVRYHEVPALI